MKTNWIIDLSRKNDIRETFAPAKSGVNGDRVFLSENFVIKFFEGRKKKYYPNELMIYSEVSEEYVAKLIDNGEIGESYYIIMERLKGKCLYSIWNELNNKERENSIKQIAGFLKKITTLKEPAVIDFRKELEELYESIMNRITLSYETNRKVCTFFDSNIKCISYAELGYLSYIDVHFDNFLYLDGKIKAIDFEALKIAPLDYQMDRWCRMCRHPDVYANASDKEKVKKGDYANLISLMTRYYPEAFNFDTEEQRLRLYSLLYNLNVMAKHNFSEERMIALFLEDMAL